MTSLWARWLLKSSASHKRPVTRKKFPYDDAITGSEMLSVHISFILLHGKKRPPCFITSTVSSNTNFGRYFSSRKLVDLLTWFTYQSWSLVFPTKFGCLDIWKLMLWNISEINNHFTTSALEWRHNGRDDVSNHQPHHCLLNRLFRCRSKKTSKLRVTGLCAGNSRGEFPAQMVSTADNVSIWWSHRLNMCFPSPSLRRCMLHLGFIKFGNLCRTLWGTLTSFVVFCYPNLKG